MSTKAIRYFIKGFTNAFASAEDDFFKSGGYYMKKVSKNRREKLIAYEKIGNYKKDSKNRE
jgi:hypothetical protein